MSRAVRRRGMALTGLLTAAACLAGACNESGITLSSPPDNAASAIKVADERIDELLAAHPDIAPDIAEAIRWSSETGPTTDAHPGAASFEPFLATDWDTATGAGTATLARDDLLSGRVIITNPSGADFTGTVLCLVNGEPDRCLVDGDRSPTVRVPYRTGLLSHLAVADAAVGDEVAVLLLVHEDRLDPLPASTGLLVIAGDAGTGTSREFEVVRAAAHEGECRDLPLFVVPEPTRRRVVSRTEPLNARIETCSPARFAPFLIADYRTVVTPEQWRAIETGPGTVDLQIPAGILSNPDVDVLNFGFIVYAQGRSHVRFSEEVHLR